MTDDVSDDGDGEGLIRQDDVDELGYWLREEAFAALPFYLQATLALLVADGTLPNSAMSPATYEIVFFALIVPTLALCIYRRQLEPSEYLHGAERYFE